jgi:hypothetical protein
VSEEFLQGENLSSTIERCALFLSWRHFFLEKLNLWCCHGGVSVAAIRN